MIEKIAPYEFAKAIDTLEQDGCVIIQNALEQDELAALKRCIDAELQASPFCRGLFVGTRTKRLGGIFKLCDEARALALNPLVLTVLDRFLGPNCDLYQINLTQAIEIHPGEVSQYPHKDDGLFAYCQTPGEKMINVMWALTEFTAENGATHVVPGSHLWLGDRLPEPHEIESAEMSKGSALIYLGSTVHGGGPNASDSARLGLTVSYCLGWLRQAENQYLTYPPEVAADFPPALQALIGYSVHRPNVGLVNNRDPIETILPCRESAAPPIDYLTEDQIRLAQEVA